METTPEVLDVQEAKIMALIHQFAGARVLRNSFNERRLVVEIHAALKALRAPVIE